MKIEIRRSLWTAASSTVPLAIWSPSRISRSNTISAPVRLRESS
jgi:hypothetical protein